jgi:RNA recognition motif-containing protein
MNIYVGNLPFSAKEDDLRDIFSEYGEVKSAKIITDRETGRSRGFGFIEMGDSEAKKAIDTLSGAELEGKQLTINEARQKREGGNNGGGDNYNRRRPY